MVDVETLKKDIDTSKNETLETHEMEEFLKSEENIKKLGEAMESNSSPELLQELENALKDLCEKLLSQTEFSENQQKILNYFVDKFGDKYPELKEKIKDKIIGEHENGDIINDDLTTDEETNENTEVDISSIQQEIDNEIDRMLQSTPLSNLQELGINISQQDKKSKGIRWIKVTEDIKKVDDLNKITEDNINQYITIPNNIPKENYAAIAENVKQILYRHLQLHPGWKTIIGKEGYSTGMSIENTRNSDKYETNLYNQIQKLQKKSLDQQVITIVKNLPNNIDLLDLWLKTTLNSKKYNQNSVLSKLYDKISPTTNVFFQVCEKNQFINELKNNYALYWLNKNNSINTDGKTYSFLNWQDRVKFQNFHGKGIKISDEVSFDELYEKTKNFYEGLKVYNISPKIPIPNILEFYNSIKNLQSRVENEKKKHEQTVRKGNKFAAEHPIINSLATVGPAPGGYMGGGSTFSRDLETQSKREFDRKEAVLMIEMANAYAKLLLKDPSMRGKKITAPKEFGGFTLDFSKTTPEAVVRDSFRENVEDQRNLFIYNLKNDRQAAFGSFLGMVGGIAGSSLVAISTGNIWATSAGFTAGLRLGNGIGQEIWNTGEFLYEQVSGNTINDGNNRVESFGKGFLRGVGVLDQNYEYVGTAKFLSGLGFDYLSTVATFGLSQKFGGFLGKLEGVKFAGGALKFGMEELILENFFVDIPMNIVQTGFEAFTGIDNGGVTVGNTSMGNERTIKGEKPYESGSLSDMLRAMKDAAQENLSFENLSQTLFNTILYGGFLEGGGGAIKKMKGYLPAGQVSNFTERSTIAATAFAGLTNFMSSKNINFNKDGKCIDTSTNLEITESDPRFKELCEHINAVNATKAGVIESFEAITETQKQMIADPENRTGLLFRLGLISPTNTPLNILKKKKELVEKKLKEAKTKGDNTKITQLEKLLDIYTDAENKLKNVGNIEGDSGYVDLSLSEDNHSKEANLEEKYSIDLPKEGENLPQILGSRFHEERRQSRLQSDGTYAPRVEKTSDQTWISEHNGQTEVDIANTPFEDLPSDWQSENLEAAKLALGLVYNKIKNGENITPEMIEEMSEIVHNKRLERNGIEGSFENQRVAYKQLSELEKEKDKNQILRAIKTVEQGNNDHFNGSSQQSEITKAETNETNDKNIELLQELGIEVNLYSIEVTKNLTEEEINTIRDINKLITIDVWGIQLIKESKLTKDNINTIEKLKNMGFEITIYDIERIKGLTKSDIINIGKLKNTGLEITIYDVEKIKGLTDNDINTIEKLKNMGFEISISSIEGIKGLTDSDISHIEKLKNMGFEIKTHKIEKIKGLTDSDISHIEKLKNIGISQLNLNDIEIIRSITENDINKIKKLYNILNNLGIKISIYNIERIKLMTDENVREFELKQDDIIKIKLLKNLGVEINIEDIENVRLLKQDDIDKIERINNLGIKINVLGGLYFLSIELINSLTEEDISKMEQLRFSELLPNEISQDDIEIIKSLTNDEITYLKSIKSDTKNIQDIISFKDYNIILNIAPIKDKRNYIKRKNEYLKNNETLSNEQFNALFKPNTDEYKFQQTQNEDFGTGKYGISDINQTDLGYCYAYTTFELLKKSNFFEVLVRTSMKETNNGREIKLPLGDPNGETIKVNKTEIDQEYLIGENRKVNINSNSALGIKILEIAFIKKSIIQNNYIHQLAKTNKLQPIILKAQEEFKETGDITITGELLEYLEAGITSDAMETIINNDLLSNLPITEKEKKIAIIKYINQGNIKIGISRDKDTGDFTVHPKIIENNKNKEKGPDLKYNILCRHAYSIERTYYDESINENLIVFVNPHNTSEKIHITIDECINIFPKRDITTININKIFNKNGEIKAENQDNKIISSN